MKKIWIPMILGLALFSSCKKVPESLEPTPTPSNEVEIATTPQEQCYESTANKSSIVLNFTVNANQEVNGKLSYALYEKDKNDGTISGTMKGDTLFADYTFMSEGISSVREVVFLQKEGNFIEGYGDVSDQNGKVIFKDKSKLKFDSKNPLTKVDCKVK